MYLEFTTAYLELDINPSWFAWNETLIGKKPNSLSHEFRAWYIQKKIPLACPTKNFLSKPVQIIYDLEENVAKIHLLDWEFCLPQAIRQWEMWNPGIVHSILLRFDPV